MSVLNKSFGIVLIAVLSLQTLAVNAQSRFVVVFNGNQNNGDSQRTLSYFDADDFDSGPLFSVYVGNDQFGNNEDPDAIDVDPETGDVYLLSFDSGSPSNITAPGNAILEDTDGDFDLYKIPFATTYYTWLTEYKGRDVRGEGLVGGNAPAAGFANENNLDYVSFHAFQNFLDDGVAEISVPSANSNRVLLSGAIEKIGEVKRNSTPDFFDRSFEFIDEDTLFIVDDGTAAAALDTATTDSLYRLVERVSTAPGSANDAVADNLDGGFNNGPASTLESWNSTRAGRVNLDFDPNGAPSGRSEPKGTAYYDNGSGVSGVWVSESDFGGDNLAFYDLGASTKSDGTAGNVGATVYRPVVTPSGANFDTLRVFNDPSDFNDPNASPDGKIDQVFVDGNGDLIIVESGFGDSDPNSLGLAVDHQPAVYRIPVLDYNDPNGRIVLGTPGPKFFLDNDPADPNNYQFTPGDTPATADPNGFNERGHWSAFDPTTNTVYMVDPGIGGTPSFGLDIYSINVDTGAVTSHLDLDDSYSLFVTGDYTDDVDFFSVLAGDFNGDGLVNGTDFLEWQAGNSPNGGSALDLAVWEENYGLALSAPVSPLTASGSVVPEPSAVMLAMIALAPLGLQRRRQS